MTIKSTFLLKESTLRRVFSMKLSYEEAIEEINACAWGKYDPRIVRWFAVVVESGAL